MKHEWVLFIVIVALATALMFTGLDREAKQRDLKTAQAEIARLNAQPKPRQPVEISTAKDPRSTRLIMWEGIVWRPGIWRSSLPEYNMEVVCSGVVDESCIISREVPKRAALPKYEAGPVLGTTSVSLSPCRGNECDALTAANDLSIPSKQFRKIFIDGKEYKPCAEQPVVELPLEPGTGPMMLMNSRGGWHPWRSEQVKKP